MRVLILGATGFIGGNIARAAVAAGYTVRAFCRPQSRRLALEGLPVEIAVGDLASPASLVSAMEGCQAVVHAAGYYPSAPAPAAVHRERASQFIRNVLDAARQAGVARLVYTSSISTVGRIPAGRLGTEDCYYWPGQMAHPYWDCKWIQEQAVLSAEGLETVTLIPSAVLGPGDVKPTTGAALLAVAKMGAWIVPTGRINIVDVRDVAQAHVRALEQGRPGERYLIGGHNVTVEEAASEVARVLGKPGPLCTVPMDWLPQFVYANLLVPVLLRRRWGMPLAYSIEALRAGQWIDSTKAVRELGLSPRPLAETIADAIAWFRERGYFRRPLRHLVSLS